MKCIRVTLMGFLLFMAADAHAQDAATETLPDETHADSTVLLAMSLEIANPTGHPGGLVLVDRAVFPPHTRERWWAWLDATARGSGFGQAARIVLDDPDPLGGPDQCSDEVILLVAHAEARAVLCTEVAVGTAREGRLTLTGWSRPDSVSPWMKARRDVPVWNFDFDGALRAATEKFLQLRMPSGSLMPRPGFAGRIPSTPAANSRGAMRSPSRPNSESVVQNSRRDESRPNVGLTVNLLQAVDGVFFGAFEIGLDGPLSLVVRGGASSQGSDDILVSASQFGGMVRWYPTRPMRDLYFGVGLMHGGATIDSPALSVESSLVTLQPAVGFKLAGAPGLALLVEGGLSIQLDASRNLEQATESGDVPGTSAGYALIEAGFSF